MLEAGRKEVVITSFKTSALYNQFKDRDATHYAKSMKASGISYSVAKEIKMILTNKEKT